MPASNVDKYNKPDDMALIVNQLKARVDSLERASRVAPWYSFVVCVDTVERDQLIPFPVSGQLAFIQTTGLYSMYDGSTWRDLVYASGTITQPYARLHRKSTQSTTNTVNATVGWTGEDVDSHGGHDNSTNNSRYTCQVEGTYSMTVTIPWDFNGAGKRQADFVKNGTTFYNGHSSMPGGSTSRFITNATRYMDMSVGDYAEVVTNQNSGGTLNMDGTLDDGMRWDIHWIRPL